MAREIRMHAPFVKRFAFPCGAKSKPRERSGKVRDIISVSHAERINAICLLSQCCTRAYIKRSPRPTVVALSHCGYVHSITIGWLDSITLGRLVAGSCCWDAPVEGTEGAARRGKELNLPRHSEVAAAAIASSSSRLFGLQLVVFQCVRRPDALMYFLSQPWHTYGRSLVCRRLCSFRCTNWVNFCGQRSQAYGFWPLCSRRCVFRLEVDEKRFLQMSHWCGFSPVCTRWCFCRCASCVNDFVQTLHLNGRSPECPREFGLPGLIGLPLREYEPPSGLRLLGGDTVRPGDDRCVVHVMLAVRVVMVMVPEMVQMVVMVVIRVRLLRLLYHLRSWGGAGGSGGGGGSGDG
uniref:Uncharacterized protein n=1 Tax=Anopheles atroparvus TaxID=41427 RepID=A0A182IUP1_ANOAO